MAKEHEQGGKVVSGEGLGAVVGLRSADERGAGASASIHFVFTHIAAVRKAIYCIRGGVGVGSRVGQGAIRWGV